MTKNIPVLYGYWMSSCAWRVRTALNLKNIPYTNRIVDLKKAGSQDDPEFVAVNPTRKIPVLVVNGTPIVESLAIIDYIENNYPGIPIYPKDPLKRAQSLGIALQIVSGIHPLQNRRVVQPLNNEESGKGDKLAALLVANGLAELEALVKRSAGKYCVGDEVSIADLCLPSILYNATTKHNLDVSAFPVISRIDAELSKLEAFQKAHAENQEDYKEFIAKKK